MCNRRNKPICQGAILLVLIGGLGYTFYLYNLTTMDLEISKSETNKYFKQQESLSSQLQVVYEHRARLERSLQKEKTDHKNTKQDFSKKQTEFLLNITRSKHEAMNRFNSLETQYNMLKAQAKETETEYNRLRQQYTRLSSEHSEVNNQQKRNFQLYKEQKTNEIASLDEEIRALKQQVVSLRTHLKSKTEEAEQFKVSSSRALSASQKYQEIIRTLQDQIASYKEKLRTSVAQAKTDNAARDVKRDRDGRTEARHQGDNVLASKEERVVEQEKAVRHQERESPARPSRSDSRHNQDRYRRHVQITPPSDSDADQADMRRPPEENANEHNQDADGEGHSDQRRNGKAVDNSQSEGDSRRDNIPLRDRNQDARPEHKEPGVKVVSPTENAVNKWADIIKVAQQGREIEGDKREAIKGIKEGWGEKEGGKRSEGDQDADIPQQRADSKQSDSHLQTQLGREEVLDKQIGKPVVQAGDVADRPGQQGDQDDNRHRVREEREHRNQDNQGDELNERDEEEGHKEVEAAGLSRESINKQMAELQETHEQKLIKQQEQLVKDQAVERKKTAVYNQVAPIPAVQRQDTAQEHQAQAVADNDDEDAENDQEDPDEEADPDDADEEDGDNLEAHPDSPQRHQVHEARPVRDQPQSHDRALKAADESNNE